MQHTRGVIQPPQAARLNSLANILEPKDKLYLRTYNVELLKSSVGVGSHLHHNVINYVIHYYTIESQGAEKHGFYFYKGKLCN